MKKYIYLGMLVAFAFVGANFAKADRGEDFGGNGENNMGRPEQMDNRDNESSDDQEEMRGKFEDRKFTQKIARFGEDRKGDEMRNLTKEERDAFKAKMEAEKEKQKELVEKMKELKPKESGKWRFSTLLRFDAAFTRMDKIITKLDARIADYKAKGVTTTDSEAALTKAKASLADAKTKLADLKTTLSTAPTTPNPADITTKTSGSDDNMKKANQGALVKEVMPKAKEVQKLLIDTQKSLNDSLKALRVSAKDIIAKEKAEKEAEGNTNDNGQVTQ